LRPRLDIAAILSRCRWACYDPGVADSGQGARIVRGVTGPAKLTR
jgi:hypothetical protein